MPPQRAGAPPPSGASEAAPGGLVEIAAAKLARHVAVDPGAPRRGASAVFCCTISARRPGRLRPTRPARLGSPLRRVGQRQRLCRGRGGSIMSCAVGAAGERAMREKITASAAAVGRSRLMSRAAERTRGNDGIDHRRRDGTKHRTAQNPPANTNWRTSSATVPPRRQLQAPLQRQPVPGGMRRPVSVLRPRPEERPRPPFPRRSGMGRAVLPSRRDAAASSRRCRPAGTVARGAPRDARRLLIELIVSTRPCGRADARREVGQSEISVRSSRLLAVTVPETLSSKSIDASSLKIHWTGQKGTAAAA